MTTADIYNPTTKQTLYKSTFDTLPAGFQFASTQAPTSVLTNQTTPSQSQFTVPPQGAIGADTLSSPVQSYKVAPTPISTGYAGLQGAITTAQGTIQSGIDAATAQNADATKIAQEQTAVESQKKSLFERLFNSPSKSSLESSAYDVPNATGSSVNSSLKELNDINNEILTEQTSARHRIEALQAAGGTKEGIALQAAQIQKDSASKLADLAVIQLSKQNNYSLAKDIADRKVNAMLEDDQNRIDALKFLYTENKDRFTKDEQRQYEAKLKTEERDFELRKLNLQNVNDAKLKIFETLAKNNAPLDAYKAVSAAAAAPGASVDSVFTAGARYGSVNTQTELQSARSEEAINQVNDLVTDPAIRSAVGPTALGRFVGRGLDTATGARQNFIANVEQLRSNLNLESLIQAKSRGATFGALSDQELRVLANAATKIGAWAIKDSNGNTTGYSASEKDFKKELDKINNFAKLDYIVKGGDPQNVGAQLLLMGRYGLKIAMEL